jgi:hypothetical protein
MEKRKGQQTLPFPHNQIESSESDIANNYFFFPPLPACS